jgi:hypothetical protein
MIHIKLNYIYMLLTIQALRCIYAEPPLCLLLRPLSATSAIGKLRRGEAVLMQAAYSGHVL